MRAESGIGKALDELVAQFADPYAFLRELVQNAIDAGSADVDVSVDFEGEGVAPSASGVISIRVDDYGVGMDREIIESKLTRLFSSDKDGDRTKIGKFGIGFVSVFALEPDAVIVDTARAGEHWRVIFDRDRTFRRIKLDTPGEGTKVQVLKAGKREDVETTTRKVREVLTYWCRFLPNEIRVDGEPINQVFDVDAPLRVKDEKETASVVLWVPRKGEPARWGFFNRGLTLREYVPPPDHTTPDLDTLQELSFFVSSPLVEHTLTRDEVIQDRHYFNVLGWVTEVAKDLLVSKLLEEACRPLEHEPSGSPARVTRESVLQALAKIATAGWFDPIRHGALAPFRTVDGEAVTIATLHDNNRAWWPRKVLWADGPSRLAAHASAAGSIVLVRAPDHVVFAKYWEQCARALVGETLGELSSLGVLHDLPSEETVARHRALCAAVAALLEADGTRCRSVTVGHFAGPSASSARPAGLTFSDLNTPAKLAEARTLPGGLFSGARHLVLDVDHPVVAAAAELAEHEPEFAALQVLKAFYLGERLDGALDTRLTELAWESRWARSTS